MIFFNFFLLRWTFLCIPNRYSIVHVIGYELLYKSENDSWLIITLATFADCPLNLTGSNFTLVASICSTNDDRGKCCRYINAFIAVSVAHYANATGNLGVTANLSETCLHSISETLGLYGVPKNATAFCGFGTKIPVNYVCEGRTTVTQMLQSPKFSDVTVNCKLPLSEDTNCRKCVNASITYLRQLVGAEDNMTLSTCRDATFTAIASQVDGVSVVEIASCFFGVQGLSNFPGITTQLNEVLKPISWEEMDFNTFISVHVMINQLVSLVQAFLFLHTAILLLLYPVLVLRIVENPCIYRKFGILCFWN